MAAVQDFLPGTWWQLAIIGVALVTLAGGVLMKLSQRKKAGA